MLLKMAIYTVWHEREKLSGAVVGVALGVFLVVFQWGLYFAYKRDTTVVLDAFDADIWIVPKNQSSFDGFTSMDDLPYWRAKQASGVQDVARIVWGDAAWRIPSSGGKDYVQVLGIDLESSIAAHFRIRDQDVASLVRPDGHVLIGTKDREKLGLAARSDGPCEISGRQAFVAGYVDDVRLFTTAGFVLTDVDNARAFLGLPSSHVNYIVCKCRPGANVSDVVRQLRAAIPEHDVLTTRQFHDLCSNYWETVSGIGPLILMSSILGVTVGFLIVIMTFYISTIEKIPVYGCLKALGGTVSEIAAILGVQVLIVFLLGSVLAGALLCATMASLRNSMVSVLITPNLIAAGLGTMLVCSTLGALLSIRRLFFIDPGEAFRT
jgi:putative ABC transport system permease protein